MKVIIASNRVMELSGTQVRNILADYLKLGQPIRSITGPHGEIASSDAYEIRWSEEPEEREI